MRKEETTRIFEKTKRLISIPLAEIVAIRRPQRGIIEMQIGELFHPEGEMADDFRNGRSGEQPIMLTAWI